MFVIGISLSKRNGLEKNMFFPRSHYRYLPQRPLAFSLIELLVVIAIIGMLLAISLPAIQRTRETARRIACVNNLRQLGLGIVNYNFNNKKFPPSGIVDIPNKVFNPQSGKMFSWVVLILPYIEERKLYDQFDFSKTVLNQPSNPQATHISTLICPSDSAQGKYFVDKKLTLGKQFTKGNYAAFVSPYHIELQMMFPGALIGKGQKSELVRDGLSHTLMLSEVRVRKHEQDQRGAWALPWNASSLLAFDMHATAKLGTPYVINKCSFGLTQLPNNLGPNVDVLYSCPDMAAAQMDKMPCGLWDPTGDFDYLSSAPRSNHPGGVNVVFMDGHTGFIMDDVDEIAMAYLISINDGKTPSISEYVQ